MQDLKSEWQLLQNQYDSYEKYSLVIKLQTLLLLSVFFMVQLTYLPAILIICLLWLLDAIWKTFQARIEVRLLHIERTLASEEPKAVLAYQFNTQFLMQRGGAVALVKEYLCSALRPSVGAIYAASLAAIIVVNFCLIGAPV